ncbi:uncharacterized protein Gasu_28850 [Galdieria sulphuraria]|uniref:Uncharacterized protein n=1 Tax=Galdieria sulphuraria TaxID=130081 RepID=M2W1V4_GALSU|nr:uncharacterized protein Gasu_28850 [Galdieria sulphuraria]EME29661.1 hypothetical protein Gasu_28850 [Galdieria sulphuraria]|eukprot:XP_005706181.1 hypothetical protein Gasu_28850 [Galdieria sulphuraria]
MLLLRPFSLVDNKGVAQAAVSSLQDSVAGRWLEDSTTEEEAEVVGVQFRRRETPKAAAWKRSSFHYQRMLRDEEPWKQLQYTTLYEVEEWWNGHSVEETCPHSTEFSLDTCSSTDSIPLWIDSLGNREHIEQVSLDVPQRVYQYLYQHRVMTLSSLLKHFSDEPLSSLLKALNEYAILINHVWVLKSEKISQLSQVEQCCRDIILETFASQDYVRTSVIRERLPYLGPLIWRSILEEVGIHHKGQGWRLKVQGEDHFGNLFHSFVIEQQKYLYQRVEKGKEYLQSLYNNGSHRRLGNVSSLPSSTTTTTTQSLTFNHMRNEHLRRWLFIFVKKYGTVSYNMVYTQAKKDCLHLLGSQEEEKEEEDKLKTILNQLLNEMCVQIRGCFILKHLNNPSVDKYRNAILRLFMKYSKLKKSDIVKALEDTFSSSISNSMYNTILHEFATFKDQSWHLKEPSY